MEKRSFQKLIMYVSIVLIFIAAVVLVFCAREVKNTTEQVNDTIKSNLDYASVSCENILTDAVNVLNVNYFTVQYIHEKNEDNTMLKEYFVEQTEYLKDRLGLSYLGIYGYIDGELMLSGQWVPPADYHVENRLWYREIIANGTDLTLATPYIDMKTGKQVLTVGRTMENGTDMVGVDLDIKNLSEMLQMLQNDIGDLYIVNSSGIIEAGTDFDMVGSSLTDYYGKNEKTQSYVDKINEELEQNSDIASYKTASSWISVKPIMNDWYVVSIINKDSINRLIAKNAIPSAVILITVLVVFFMLYLNLFVRLHRTEDQTGTEKLEVYRYSSGAVLEDDKRLKYMVFYTYLLLICFFVTTFLRYESGVGFVITTFCTVPGCVYMTCSEKTPVKAHGFCMTGCLFMIIAMYGLLPDGHNRLTDMFLTAMVIISLYQMVELNIFMLVSTEIYYLYALLSDHMQDASGGRDIDDCITDMIIILLGSLMLLVVIAWNKRLQIRLKQNAQEAEEAANSESAFLANISHEIRTPLNAILGMNELVLRESRQPHIKEYAMYIKNSGKTLLTIISDILDLSKIESGKVDIIIERYSLSSLIEDVERSIQKRVMEKNLQFNISVSPYMHEYLQGDEVRIKQIIMNLLTNAVKYTEKGCISLRITGESQDTIQKLFIEVADTGIGMRDEDLGKLFTKFERFDLKRNRSVEGTGLGLPIVKSLLDAMGGTIQVQSVYGKGSTFTVALTQKIADEEPVGDYRERYKKQIQTEIAYHEMFHAERAHVLVVDDNEVNLKIIEGLAKRTGIQMDMTTSAKQGLAMIRKQEYQLFLIDHMMPEMDGLIMLQKIKGMDGGKYKHIPAIAITANALSDAKQMYLDAGFNGYLSKPIDPERFERILMENLPDEYITVCDKMDAEAHKSDVPATQINIPGIDAEKGLSYIGNSEELYIDLLQTYLTGSEERIQKLDAGRKNRDLQAYEIAIHGLKGISASIGADDMAQAAARLEVACRHEETAWTEIDREHADTMRRYRDLLRQIKKWLANIESDGTIETTGVTDITEVLIILDRMKQEVYDYREQAACEDLKKLYHIKVPAIQKELGTGYFGILDRLHTYISDYDMDKAYDVIEKLETDIRRML